MRKLSLTLLLAIGLTVFWTCDNQGDLDSVAGVQGVVSIQGTIPDSIKALVLGILSPGAAFDQENIGDYLYSYSDPFYGESEYFIQLKKGGYLATVIGLKIDPGLFVANIDFWLSQEVLPFELMTPDIIVFNVQTESITKLNIEVTF